MIHSSNRTMLLRSELTERDLQFQSVGTDNMESRTILCMNTCGDTACEDGVGLLLHVAMAILCLTHCFFSNRSENFNLKSPVFQPEELVVRETFMVTRPVSECGADGCTFQGGGWQG